MSLLHKKTIEETALAKEMSWEDSFARFECLKLTLVYDDSRVFNEILRIDAGSGRLQLIEQSHYTKRRQLLNFSSTLVFSSIEEAS